jgi:hypothetical protein
MHSRPIHASEPHAFPATDASPRARDDVESSLTGAAERARARVMHQVSVG